MAPSFDGHRAVQSNRQRPTPVKAVIPAVPLRFAKKSADQPQSTGSDTDTPKSAEVTGSASNQPQHSPIQVSNGVTEDAPITQKALPDTGLKVNTEQVNPPGAVAEPLKNGVTTTPPHTAMDGPNHSRQAPYQLPPPFYPANYSPGPSSAGSSNFPPQHPYYHDFRPRQSRYGHGEVVFGSFDASSSASPAPPNSAGAAPPYQSHYPNYMSNGYQQTYYPQETHGHMAGYQESYMFPAGHPALHQQEGYYPARPGYEYYAGHGRMHSFVPPESYSPFTPSATPLEGEPYSAPQPTSLRAMGPSGGSDSSALDDDAGPTTSKVAPADQEGPETAAERTSVPGDVTAVQIEETDSERADGGVPKALPSDERLQNLQSYLLNELGNADLADCHIELRHSEGRFPTASILAHGLIMGRSPALRALMESVPKLEVPKTVVVETTDRFFRADSFERALQHLYGAPLLDLDTLSEILQTHSQTEKMNFALGYSVAGDFLQFSAITQQGVKLASQLLELETVETALEFGLTGSLDTEWLAAHPPAGEASRSVSRRPSSVTVPSLADSVSGSVSVSVVSSVSVTPNTSGDAEEQPGYTPFAKELLRHAIDFFISNFPSDFTLDNSAPQSINIYRFPKKARLRITTPNVSQPTIQFGDHPAQKSVQATPASTSLSRVLLSLPFPLVQHILESPKLGIVHNGDSTGMRQRVARSVIAEREQRRRAILLDHKIRSKDRKAHAKDWENIGWQESVITTFGGQANSDAGGDGVEIVRKFRGFINPREKRYNR
ncbi:MAG: hypothetical protein M1833_003934 [Piccolia ochrophora]|nr:MAG: hypothetical protein M1833_003934 [Piccolia ochrophora]